MFVQRSSAEHWLMKSVPDESNEMIGEIPSVRGNEREKIEPCKKREERLSKNTKGRTEIRVRRVVVWYRLNSNNDH